ncbi:hypothetical protein BVX97_03015 [bacterium E08(2017)]|nr:hypothetical protein BVX97_03015 [bacterium E08(2017)]
MYVKVYSSIDEIRPEEWNSIVGHGRLICRHEFLLAVERSSINDCRFFYPVVYNDSDQIIAHACVYRITTKLDVLADGIARKAVEGIRKVSPKFLSFSFFECGTPVALGNTISFRKDVVKTEPLRLIVAEAERLAGSNDSSITLFRDFHEEDARFFDVLEGYGYRKVRNLPYAQMMMNWQSYGDYENAMRSRYRHKLQSMRKKYLAAGWRTRQVTDFSGMSELLARLWMETYNRAKEYRREILTPSFFDNMNTFLGDESSVLLAEKGDHVGGFLLLLNSQNTLVPLYCGLDYEVSKDMGIYFNLFYDAIDIAIAEGVHDIDLGITTLEPKLEMGAEVKDLYMYMKHSNSMLNRILPGLFDSMTPEPEARTRNVFKAQ